MSAVAHTYKGYTIIIRDLRGGESAKVMKGDKSVCFWCGRPILWQKDKALEAIKKLIDSGEIWTHKRDVLNKRTKAIKGFKPIFQLKRKGL